jgi:pyruvate,water dikinase
MRILRRTLGDKQMRIVRDESTGSGTVTQDVPAELQTKQALSDDEVAQLASLGWDVMEYYEGFPQDIEWALAEDNLYLLQARPITGVEFSWDADCDAWQSNSEDEDDVWTRGWADEVWSGAITPLTYSLRAKSQHDAEMANIRAWGHGDLSNKRLWKFHKSEAYRNANMHRSLIERTAPKEFRPAMLAYFPQHWHQEVLAAPYSLKDYAAMYLRLAAVKPEVAVHRAVATAEKWLADSSSAGESKSDSELRRLSDATLERYLQKQIAEETEYFETNWSAGFLYFRDGVLLLNKLITEWYSGDNGPALFMDLISGASKRTKTVVENTELWKLATQIRKSSRLTEDFKSHSSHDWVSAFEQSDEGRAFLADYDTFMSGFGHRGHADRDLIFSRRSEDPAIDYRALHSLLAAEGAPDPDIQEAKMHERRAGAVDQLLGNLQQQPFGLWKTEFVKLLLDFIDRFNAFRDDERYYVDRYMFVMKRCYLEVGRRLVDRSLVERADDAFFLAHDELFDLLRSGTGLRLARAKIAARRRNFDRFHVEGVVPPPYLQGGIAAALDAANDADGDTWRGIGTSRGSVTGKARIVKRLEDINLVQRGEILVTNHTDPGWTPVFMIISGIVLETGGALAHGSCLAREYGFPAVQVANAMQLIPDGAQITVNGDTGEVALADEEAQEPDGSVEKTTAGV